MGLPVKHLGWTLGDGVASMVANGALASWHGQPDPAATRGIGDRRGDHRAGVCDDRAKQTVSLKAFGNPTFPDAPRLVESACEVWGNHPAGHGVDAEAGNERFGWHQAVAPCIETRQGLLGTPGVRAIRPRHRANRHVCNTCPFLRTAWPLE